MKQNIRQYLTKYGYIWLVFLVAFIPRLLFLGNVHTLSIAGDEIFSMWPAAKAVGYEWEGIMSDYRYYGYGYSLLLVPFFKFIKDSVWLYRSLVMLMILAQSMIAPICYHLMEKYLKIKDKKVLCLTGIACSYLVTVRAVYTYPEFIYVLVFWLIIWTMFKLVEAEGRKRNILTILLILLMTYSLTVHSRGVTIWLALVGTIIFCLWVYRKSIVSIPTCIVVGAIGYIGGKWGIKFALTYLGSGQVSEVSNTGITISRDVMEYLRLPQAWNACLNIVVGQLNEAIIGTAGIAAAVVIILLSVLWKALRRDERIINTEKIYYQPYVVIGVFCLLAVIITIGGQMITWLPGVVSAMNGGDSDAFRAFTYFRYYGAYTGPLLMLGIAYFAKDEKSLDWVKGKALLVAGCLQGYWVLCILQYVCYFNGCVWSYAPFSFTKGFVDEIGVRSYLAGTFVIVISLIIGYYLCIKKRSKYVLWILCAFLLYNYGYNAVNHEGARGNMNYEYISGGREMIDRLRAEQILPEKIYVEKSHVENTGQTITCLYQFYCLDVSVEEGTPTDDKDNIFICYNLDEYKDLLDEGYQLLQLSDWEYAYVRGDEILESLQ